jgi:hypothetical protein
LLVNYGRGEFIKSAPGEDGDGRGEQVPSQALFAEHSGHGAVDWERQQDWGQCYEIEKIFAEKTLT